VVFGGEGGISNPPRVVSGIRGGGSVRPGGDMCPSGNYFSQSPPLLKL
jgi:hypothetical protein